MRARFFAIAALVLGLASCQKDFAPEANLGGDVDFRFSVSAPELAKTRAGENGADENKAKDSAFGAIDYFQGADWSKVDLRYTLEIYDADENGDLKNGVATIVKDRQAIVVDEYKAVTFETRLAPKRNYRFVVFADFVENGAATAWTEAQKLTKDGLNHSFAQSLTNITLINEAINDEAADAYFAYKHVVPSNNTHNTDAMTLTRPYGKVRVVATDLAELNLNVKPGSVVVTYNKSNPALFNAVTGVVDFEEVYAEKEFSYNYADGIVYTEGYDALQNEKNRNTHMTLFTDYILATDAQSSIHFDMLVNDTDGVEIKYTSFNTEIPVQRNHLTTIIGNVLTTATEVEVTINDNFENADHQNWVFDAFVNGGVVTLEEDLVIGATLYVEADAVLNLNGHSIINTADNQWEDVIVVRGNGKLTINGEGTIQAVSGNEGYAVIVRDNGELTINGGAYKSGVDADGAANAVVYVRDNGKVFVNGGTFYNEFDSKYVLNKKDANRDTTVIEVRGGKFEKFNPENNAAENAGTNFCAEGYGAFQDGVWYEVFSMAEVGTVDEFKAAAADADIQAMRFVADINFGTSTATVTTDKIIYGEGHKLQAGGTTSSKNYGLGVTGANVVVNDLVMNEGRGGIYATGGANLVINNVSLKTNYSASGRHMFYVSNATLTINSGTFEVGRTGCKYFSMEKNARAYVTGGTFEDMMAKDTPVALASGATLEISGGKFQVGTANYKFDPTAYLAEGYKAERVGNYMEVSEE